MRTRTFLVFGVGCVLGVAVGFWIGRAPQRSPTLATVLQARGISPEAITHFRFVGDEGSLTSGRVAVDTNVTWIWDGMIATAEPYSYWLPSGYRRVEIFTRGQDRPAAVLFVNETDATHLEGDSQRFMCHGLEGLALHLLSPPQTAKSQ
jgi:hypothetical protein